MYPTLLRASIKMSLCCHNQTREQGLEVGG
jgi:hypothetical protein